MRVVALALGCLAGSLGWVGARASAAQCELKRTGSAEITLRDNRVLVPVTLNGHRATMELNTAAASSWISSAYMQPFGLKPDRHFNVTWSGARMSAAQVTWADSMRVGSQSFRRPALVALGDSRPASAGAARDTASDTAPDIGQLGMNLLAIEDFEIDFARHELNFYARDHCPGAVVYWTDRYSSVPISRRVDPGPFHLPMEVEGRKILAVISTASPVTMLGTDVTRKLFGFDESSAGVETETDGAGAGHGVTHYRVMALAGSGMTIANARIQLVSRRPGPGRDRRAGCELMTHGPGGVAYYEGCLEEAPLTLGLDVLRRLHLYFATQERVLYFSEAGAGK